MLDAFVAFSWSELPSRQRRDQLINRATAALELLRGRSDFERMDTTDGTLVATRGHLPPVGERVSLTRTAAPSGWSAVTPPGAWLRLSDADTVVTSDGVGLKHLHFITGDGWSAVSGSALVLGVTDESPLDPVAWASLALLGFVIDGRAVFDRVHRVPRNTQLRLHRGAPGQTVLPSADLSESSGAEALRRAVSDHLDAAPDAGLELSGGLDSRIILAAIPPSRRVGRSAVTIGAAGDPDVEIARRIARTHRLEHLVVDPGQQQPSTEDGLALVRRAAQVRDAAADPLAAATLDLAEARMPPGARFTGVNGEYVRGFYYPGTSRGGAVTARRVTRLFRWRMVTNHRVTPALFDPAWLEEATSEITRRVISSLRATGMPLRPATDEFYLHQRVVGWAGPGYSHTSTRRPVLAPFLHPSFLDWARRTPPRLRHGSQALVRVLAELDPSLAQIPLAAGPVPTALSDGGWRARRERASTTARKVGRKVNQKLAGRRRPPTGSGSMLPLVQRAWEQDDPRVAWSSVPFIDASWLAQMRPSGLDAATTSFLVNLECVTSFSAAVEARLAASESGTAEEGTT